MPRRTNQSDAVMTALTLTGRGLLGIGKWLWRTLLGQRSIPRLNKIALLADWQTIESLTETNNQAQLAQAVVQADRFVDYVMQQVGGRGTSFADRLRSLEGQLGVTTYQGLWDAHKLRNQLAHEHGRQVSSGEVRTALLQFRTAVRQLGAF